MEEIKNKCIELSQLIMSEIDNLTKDEQDKIYNVNKRIQLTEKDGKIYLLSSIYEFLNDKLIYLNRISNESKGPN